MNIGLYQLRRTRYRTMYKKFLIIDFLNLGITGKTKNLFGQPLVNFLNFNTN